MPIEPPPPIAVAILLDMALAEDGYERDITSEICTPKPLADVVASRGVFELVAREHGVFAGSVALEAIAQRFSGRLSIEQRVVDGQPFVASETIARLTGNAGLILRLERTMLNFLQRLCGVATATNQYVQATKGTSARIYDTRKTIPGWRELDKYAVRCGGGCNHRMGLHDAVLIKDNHLAGIEPIALPVALAQVLDRLAGTGAKPAFVEVEVDTFEQIEYVLALCDRIDIILLDNFSLDDMRAAVRLRDAKAAEGQRRVALEVSGRVTLDAVPAIAATGIDRIAVGAITHSAAAVDLGLDRTA